MQSRRPHQISSPWSPKYPPFSEITKRGGTAPRPEKPENVFTQSRVPTSSSKYAMNQIPTSSISIKGSGYTSSNSRQPVKTSNSIHIEARPELKLQKPDSPIPENFEHVWEEGTKRPKTQNIKCRRTSTGQETSPNLCEIFPAKGPAGNNLYDVPIIVAKDDKNRRTGNKNPHFKYAARPLTSKPQSSLLSSLDQDFLDLFQV